MNRGIIYYNTGTHCTVRLLVSLFSLRKHYSGPVTILSEGEASHAICQRIGATLAAEVKEWDCGVPAGRNRAFLAKTRYYEGTPYETTIALDADTIIVGNIDDLFGEAESAGFCVAQIANWKSNGRIIAKRIRAWERWLPEDILPALRFGPAINCGVVAFHKNTPLYRDWMHLALPGRESFIPDEVCCQVVLHRYPHRVLDGRWNRSCKYDDPAKPETRIIHFHGNKHCRPELPFNGNIWVRAFNEVRTRNLANIENWLPAGDKMLAAFLSDEIAETHAKGICN